MKTRPIKSNINKKSLIMIFVVSLLVVIAVAGVIYLILNATVIKDAAYYYSLGTLADNNHNLVEAEKDFKQSISLDPSFSDSYIGLGGIYYEKGNYDLELSNYQEAVKLDPSSDNTYLLATALEDNGLYQQAEKTYENALKIKEDNKDALHDLGILYLTLGETAKTKNLVSRLILLDKGWGNELNMLTDRMK